MTHVLFLLFLGVLSVTAAAQAPTTAPAAAPLSVKQQAALFIDTWQQQSLLQLTDMSVPEAVRIQRFRQIYRSAFDVPATARFVLGRYWNVATPQEQNEFMQLFEHLLMQTYRQKLRRYKGHSAKVLGASDLPNGQYLVGASFTNPTTGRIAQLGWQVGISGNRFVILDLQIEGFSVAGLLRNQYADVIQRGGGRVDALLYQLRLAVSEGGTVIR
ncbi:MAG: phospholipid-binding protein MlaC [Holosporales bacterium]